MEVGQGTAGEHPAALFPVRGLFVSRSVSICCFSSIRWPEMRRAPSPIDLVPPRAPRAQCFSTAEPKRGFKFAQVFAKLATRTTRRGRISAFRVQKAVHRAPEVRLDQRLLVLHTMDFGEDVPRCAAVRMRQEFCTECSLENVAVIERGSLHGIGLCKYDGRYAGMMRWWLALFYVVGPCPITAPSSKSETTPRSQIRHGHVTDMDSLATPLTRLNQQDYHHGTRAKTRNRDDVY